MDIFSSVMEDLLHGNEYMFQVKQFQNSERSSIPFSFPGMDIFSSVMEDLLHGNVHMFQV
jgi:hypothetical protein